MGEEYERQNDLYQTAACASGNDPLDCGEEEVKVHAKRRRNNPASYAQIVTKLQGTLDLAAAQAASADVHVANGTADGHADTLGVRQPNAVALAVGVAHVVAAHGALLADFTNLSH